MSIDVTVSGLNTEVEVSLETHSIKADIVGGSEVTAKMSDIEPVSVTIPKQEPLTPEYSEYIAIGAEEYSGSYEVIPKTEAQILATTDKLMRDDVIVYAIPYYETSNVSGTTVYIGGL